MDLASAASAKKSAGKGSLLTLGGHVISARYLSKR